MRPLRFELPTLLKVENGRATISPGHWEGADGVRATGTVVSVRKITGESWNPANWPVVFGATEVPPASTTRPTTTPGFLGGDPIMLPPLPAGDYRLELWRGSATTDGNQPGSPAIWEWGIYASNERDPSNAVLMFTVPGETPPPPPPDPPEVLLKKARAACRALVLHLRNAEGMTWQDIKAHPWGHAYYNDLGGK